MYAAPISAIARLVGANFTDARLGVRPLTGVVFLAAALVVSIVAGVVIGSFAETVRDRTAESAAFVRPCASYQSAYR